MWLQSESCTNLKAKFVSNREEFWKVIENSMINSDINSFEINHISNLIIDLSNVEQDLSKGWQFLRKAILQRISSIDTYGFTLICVGFSKVISKDAELWAALEKFACDNINKFDIDEIRKMILSFLKISDCKLIWKKIESRIADPEILKQIDFELFTDLQIPLAIFSLSNEQIWRKFEEQVFKNLKAFSSDTEILMNTLYSFSKVDRGSKLFWTKIIDFVQNDISIYDVDDLGHIAMCIKPKHINLVNAGKNEKESNLAFWGKYKELVLEKLEKAKFNACNNLLKGVEDNEYLKEDKQFNDAVSKRLDILVKEIPK